MTKELDLTGHKYGRLTVIKKSNRKRNGINMWICVCDCGNQSEVSTRDLRSGHTRSCGCLRDEKMKMVRYKNGLSSKDYRLYSIWSKVLIRCNNPKAKEYPNYGGRGIRVCDEWQGENGAENFFEWAYAHGYKVPLTLERVDVNGNYEPSNCTWIPKSKQADNTRRTNRYTYKGETLTLNEFAEKYNLNVVRLRSRVYSLKWDIARAIEEPRHESFDDYNAKRRKK